MSWQWIELHTINKTYEHWQTHFMALTYLRWLWAPPADRHQDGVGIRSWRGGGSAAGYSHGSGLPLSAPWTLKLIKPTPYYWCLWEREFHVQDFGLLSQRKSPLYVSPSSPLRCQMWSPMFSQAEPWLNHPTLCWLQGWRDRPESGHTLDGLGWQSVILPASRCLKHPSSVLSIK